VDATAAASAATAETWLRTGLAAQWDGLEATLLEAAGAPWHGAPSHSLSPLLSSWPPSPRHPAAALAVPAQLLAASSGAPGSEPGGGVVVAFSCGHWLRRRDLLAWADALDEAAISAALPAAPSVTAATASASTVASLSTVAAAAGIPHAGAAAVTAALADRYHASPIVAAACPSCAGAARFLTASRPGPPLLPQPASLPLP